MLKRFKLDTCKQKATPLVFNEKISKEDGEKSENPSIYRSTVGSLLYLTETRPDIMFSVGLLSRFATFPSNVHTGIAKVVIGYLHGTKDHDIWYL